MGIMGANSLMASSYFAEDEDGNTYTYKISKESAHLKCKIRPNRQNRNNK